MSQEKILSSDGIPLEESLKKAERKNKLNLQLIKLDNQPKLQAEKKGQISEGLRISEQEKITGSSTKSFEIASITCVIGARIIRDSGDDSPRSRIYPYKENGWGTRIRTWVGGVRVRSPTARRSPSSNGILIYSPQDANCVLDCRNLTFEPFPGGPELE